MSYRDQSVLVAAVLASSVGACPRAWRAGAKVTIITPSRQKHTLAAIDLEARGHRVLKATSAIAVTWKRACAART